MFCSSVRTYPPGFGRGLNKIMDSWRPQPRLRQKLEVNLDLSDREIFDQMKVGDLWHDADLVGAYRYFRLTNKSRVPNTWQKSLEQLDSELAELSPN